MGMEYVEETVGSLIAKLEKYDKNIPIVLITDDTGWEKVQIPLLSARDNNKICRLAIDGRWGVVKQHNAHHNVIKIR